ncbi:uncharacterized protein LOC113146746, partial [Cyclospora cayetanensis]|uniref:Uncharacterized protein LOC113146746 n=1 Tax=Cyclospora cayetanensis TaxID=88456 RepID=A0A6P6RTI0_9EIME
MAALQQGGGPPRARPSAPGGPPKSPGVQEAQRLPAKKNAGESFAESNSPSVAGASLGDLSAGEGISSSCCRYLRVSLSRILKIIPAGRKGRALREAVLAADALAVSEDSAGAGAGAADRQTPPKMASAETGRAQEATKNATSVESLTERICSLATAADEAVVLQVVRCLLTALTAARLPLHGGTLLEAFATLFSVCVSSSAEENRRTAHAALLQAISGLVLRAEAAAEAAADSVQDAAVELPASLAMASSTPCFEKRESGCEEAAAGDEIREFASAEAATGIRNAYTSGGVAAAAAAAAHCADSCSSSLTPCASSQPCSHRSSRSRRNSSSACTSSSSTPVVCREMRDLLVTLQAFCRIVDGQGSLCSRLGDTEGALLGGLEGSSARKSRRLALEMIHAVAQSMSKRLWRSSPLVLLVRQQMFPALSRCISNPAMCRIALQTVCCAAEAAETWHSPAERRRSGGETSEAAVNEGSASSDPKEYEEFALESSLTPEHPTDPHHDAHQQQYQQMAPPSRSLGSGGSTRLSALEVQQRRELKLQLRGAVALFNKKPTEGIAKLLALQGFSVSCFRHPAFLPARHCGRFAYRLSLSAHASGEAAIFSESSVNEGEGSLR